MINFKLINLKKIIFFLISIFLIFISQKIISEENRIIFKINNKPFTSLDYEMIIKYLDFVGSNSEIKKSIVINDFISANLFSIRFNLILFVIYRIILGSFLLYYAYL